MTVLSEIVKVIQIADVSLPLSRLTAIHADESAVEAIGDWHYSLAQGYCSKSRPPWLGQGRVGAVRKQTIVPCFGPTTVGLGVHRWSVAAKHSSFILSPKE
jgi:hypothetical protein